MKTALHVFEHFDNMNVTEVNLGDEVVKMSIVSRQVDVI